MPYPTYAPVYQPQPHRSPSELLKPLVSDFVVAIGTAFGLFLVMLGSLIYGLSQDYWEAGLVLGSLGAFILVTDLFMAAIMRADMEKWVRFALVAAATVLTIWWFSFTLMGQISLF
jgi:hypothetical protein